MGRMILRSRRLLGFWVLISLVVMSLFDNVVCDDDDVDDSENNEKKKGGSSDSSASSSSSGGKGDDDGDDDDDGGEKKDKGSSSSSSQDSGNPSASFSAPSSSEYQVYDSSSEGSGAISFGSSRGWSLGSSSAATAGGLANFSPGGGEDTKPSSVAYGNFFGMIGGGYAAYKAFELEECKRKQPPPVHCRHLLPQMGEYDAKANAETELSRMKAAAAAAKASTAEEASLEQEMDAKFKEISEGFRKLGEAVVGQAKSQKARIDDHKVHLQTLMGSDKTVALEEEAAPQTTKVTTTNADATHDEDVKNTGSATNEGTPQKSDVNAEGSKATDEASSKQALIPQL